jgi:predicted metal-dependent hydrolase
MSTALTVRRLHIDLSAPVARHWCGGDAFATAFFNALSMSFPRGEQYFIDALKRGLEALPPALRARHEADVRAFIGQEATHRHIHGQFNAQLARQGLINHWEARTDQRLRATEGGDPRHALGVTAATEHLTAILSEWGLANSHRLHSDDERVSAMWLWHLSEELEHKAIAIDVYRSLGGNEEWRRRYFKAVSTTFAIDLTRQTLNNLWHDGSGWWPSTWLGAWRLLLSADGLLRRLWQPWRDYLRDGFHPEQLATTDPDRWLRQNPHRFSAVRAT